MTHQTIETIRERISVAQPSSPIAVFECGRAGLFNAVFADTVESRKWLKKGKDYFGFELIGVWHQYDNINFVMETLRHGKNN